MEHFSKPYTYAVWTKDSDVRFKSTSGGAFTEFAKKIIDNDGYVVGAQYDKDNLVEHVMVSDYDGIERIRQSKYIQSRIGNVYCEIKDKLNQDKLVGFCGSPCQVAGLYAYLGKDYDNLITMDFICRGMNSPKAYKAWLNEIEKKEKSKATRVWFKYKEGGWKSSPRRTRVDFADGHFKVYEAEKNLFMYGYLSSNLYIRPSCGKCAFKGVPRQGDITFADFWGIDEKYDDDKGTSLLLINSDKGNKLFSLIKDRFKAYEMDFNSIFEGNPMFSESVKVPEEASAFLKDLDYMSFSDCLKKYHGYPKKNLFILRILRKVKRTIINR